MCQKNRDFSIANNGLFQNELACAQKDKCQFAGIMVADASVSVEVVVALFCYFNLLFAGMVADASVSIEIVVTMFCYFNSLLYCADYLQPLSSNSIVLNLWVATQSWVI